MARSIRFTKAERDFLKLVLGPTMDWSHLGTKVVKTAAACLKKLEESEEQTAGVEVGPIEEALIAAARGKVLALEGGFGRASVMAASMKVTPELAALVGSYLARNNFFTGPFTLLDVLNKWYQWLPKARATAPPTSLPSGLGPAGKTDAPDVGSPAAAGKAATSGRRAPGFR